MTKSKPQISGISKVYLVTILLTISTTQFVRADDAPEDRDRKSNSHPEREIAELRAAVDELSALVDRKLARANQPLADTAALEKKNRELESQLKLTLKKLEERENDLNEYNELALDLANELEELEASLDNRVAVLNRERDELTSTLKAEREVFEEMRNRWSGEREEMKKLRKLVGSQNELLEKQHAAVKNGATLVDQTRAQLLEEKVVRQKLELQIKALRDRNKELVANLDLLQNPPSISPVFFTRNAAQSEAEFGRVLEEAKAILKRAPRANFHIVGHTCDLGSDEENLTLSKFRARLLADHLGRNGIPEKKLSFEGRGETEPAVDNDSEENRAKNRRTEILVVLPAQ
ncbi:MAG: OmpA family protein [Verrucomicrobiota bacterium]